jgi:hypothetical protein
VKNIPFDFVLEALTRLDPTVRPMFGCHAIYIGEKITIILRNRKDHEDDNGVWIATSSKDHESLLKEFSSLRSINLLGGKITEWQNLPADGDSFEEDAIKICELILAGDSRIGKIPKRKQVKKASKKKTSKKSSSRR